MELIKKHKLFVAIILGLFLPASKIIFGVLGFASGFVNWGVAFLVGLAFLVRWAYPRLREFAEDS
jgi:uncharacterized membrane protein YraQ (UPF0718 family)